MTIGAALTIAFVVLKLLGHIDWAWPWVVAPAWAEITLWLIVVGLGVVGIGFFSRKRKEG